MEYLNLPVLLAWGQPPCTQWHGWQASYRQLVRDRLDEVLAGLNDLDRRMFETAFAVLPDHQRRRILASPWITDRLTRRGGPLPDPQQLALALLAEVDPLAASVSFDGLLTTALGDAAWQRGRALYDGAPLTKLTDIPIDFASDRAMPHMGGCGNRLAPHEYAEAELIAERIGAALGALERALPACSAIVRAFTHVLVLRRELDEPDRFRSGTFDRYVGLVFLRNGHLPTVSRARVVDALVHESIHNLLFVCEAVTEPFWDDSRSLEHTVRSPWTGTDLALPSFVHACFVWYGLYRLWDCVLAGDDVDLVLGIHRAEAEALRARARRGFDEADLVALLADNRTILHADVVEGVGELQHCIRNRAADAARFVARTAADCDAFTA